MKSSISKKLGILFTVFTILIVVGIFTIPRLINLNNYSHLIVKTIEKATGGKITVGNISWGIANGIWLEVDEFSIADASAFPADVKLSRISASVSITPLLAKKVVLKKLLLESPEVRIRLEPRTGGDQRSVEELTSRSHKTETHSGDEGQPNASSSKTKVTKDNGSPTATTKPAGIHLPVEIEIEQLAVEIGRLELDDAVALPGQTLVHVFTDVNLTGTNLVPGQEMAFNLALRDKAPSGLGRLMIQGTFSGLTDILTLENPNLKLKAVLTSLNMEAIKPYLINSLLRKRLNGSLSMEINYQGDLNKNQRATGLIDLSRITYTDPSFWEASLPGQKTTLTYQVKFDPHDLAVEKIALKLGSLSLSARADVHSLDKDPVIKNAEVSYDLPLPHLIPLIPLKLLGKNAGVIRSILEGGGRITANNMILPEIRLTKLPATLTSLLVGIEMTAQIVDVSVRPTPKMPKIENITGTFQLANGIAQVKGLKTRIASVNLPEISAKITNLEEKPKIDAHLNGRFSMDGNADEKLAALLREIGVEKLVGAAEVDLAVALETARPEDFQLQGNLRLRDIQIKTVYTPAQLQGFNADITIKPNVANISQASTTVKLPTGATSHGRQFKLKLQGRVDGWRRKPAVTLQNLKTSPISLPLLASVVPWEKFEKSARAVKETLLSGGTVTVEDMALPKISLSKPPKNFAKLLPKVKFAASFVDLTVPLGSTQPKIEGITARVTLENNVLTANNVHAKLGPLSLSALNIHATNIADYPKVSLSAKGPLQVTATSDAKVEKLLMKHGLKSLSGSAVVDLSADFDLHKPKSWNANGSLVLNNVRAKTHPAAVFVDSLKGTVKYNRKKTTDIIAQDITARINQAPVRLSGKLIGIGTSKVTASARAYTKQLDLGHLTALLPALKDLKLRGMLDMDLDMHVPYNTLGKSRLKGTLKIGNASFQLAANDLIVDKGNTEIELNGSTAKIKTMTMHVNDQKVALSGQLSGFEEPKLNLLVTSRDLNLDRLLPHDKPEKPLPKPVKDKGGQTKDKPVPAKKVGTAELPPLAHKLTAVLQVKANQGQYKGLQFQKLKLNILYKHGVIESYYLNLGTGDSHIETKGSANLQDLDHIKFTVDPDVNALQIGKVAPLFGIDKLPLNGPMSLKGQLRGRTGNTKELLGSLDGHLNAEIGPGYLNKIGKVGEMLAKLFSTVHIRSIFSGRMFKDLSGKGIPFQTIKGQISFERGTLNLNKLHLGSDAMNVDGQGTIDLVNQKLNIIALLKPLVTVDKTLNLIPIVGKAAEHMTQIRMDVEGSLKDPKIYTAEIKEFGKSLEGPAKALETILKDVGKGLKKIF